jgi:ADP-heptose:LPS heptosyltransferase
MNLPTLVILDKIAIFFFFPFFFILKIKNYIFKLKAEKNLIIKIAGAGNLFSLRSILKKNSYELITLERNRSAVIQINNKLKVYFINDKNLCLLFFSILILLFKLFLKKYKKIIMLEASSNLGILISLFPFSNQVLGITNKLKSFTDFLFLDFYLANISNISHMRIFNLLIKFKPQKNENFFLITQKFQKQFILKFNSQINEGVEIKKIVIAPGCAKNDRVRRLRNETWLNIIKILKSKKITVIFDTILDEQYEYFARIASDFNNVNVKVTTYPEFIFEIKNTDLLVCIDSQSLRLANFLNKISVSFYGPSGISHVETPKLTYPIYNSFECSPCNHKYFKYPCKGLAPCMKFDKKDLEFLEKI